MKGRCRFVWQEYRIPIGFLMVVKKLILLARPKGTMDTIYESDTAMAKPRAANHEVGARLPFTLANFRA